MGRRLLTGVPSIPAVEPGDPRIRELVASVAGSVGDRLAAVTGDIQDVIEQAIPGLQRDESAMLLHADFAMIEVHPVAPLLQMSVFRDELVGRAHRGCHARRLENLLGFGGAALRGPSTYRGVEFVLLSGRLRKRRSGSCFS